MERRVWKKEGLATRSMSNLKQTYCSKNSVAWFGEPKKAERPSAISKILSNIPNSSELGWWIVMMIVFPLLASRFSTCNTLWAMNESKPDVGSSHNSKWGSVKASDANAKRFRSPPDNPLIRPGDPMTVLAHFRKLNSMRTSLTRWTFSLYGMLRLIRSIAWKIKCSRAVSDAMNKSSCWT